MCCFTLLQAGNLKAKCQQDCFLLALGQGICPQLSSWFLWLETIFDVPCLVCALVFTWPFLCVSVPCIFFLKGEETLDLGATLIQNDPVSRSLP
jgi:hypothetical protein